MHTTRTSARTALAAFVAASAVCGAAPTAAVLVTARIAQGAAGGILNPQISATIQQLLQGAERGKAFGYFASVVSVASAIGPLAGGALIAAFGVHAGWRAVFYVNVCFLVGVLSGMPHARILIGQPSLRLPRAADLAPPALAIRLLDETGQHARFSVIAPLRVAGSSAAGLQMTPTDPASTIARIDIWAEPDTGLPLMVEIFGRGSSAPALESQFFVVGRWRPDAAVLTPQRGPGTGFTTTSARSLSGELNNLGEANLPRQLAGRDRVPEPRAFDDVGVYGGGLSTFVVLGIRGAGNLLADAVDAGGVPFDLPGGYGALLRAPLINAVIAQPAGSSVTYLVAGPITTSVLERSAATLIIQGSYS